MVNIQVLFVFTVGYVDMTTHLLTKYYYIIERVYFIYRLFISLISTRSYLRYKKGSDLSLATSRLFVAKGAMTTGHF